MSVSPEMLTKVAAWRQSSRDGTITREEMREAISFLRAERQAMPEKAASKVRTAKVVVSGDDLLSELDGL